jgi:sterol 3beta-glucosyltransferase
MKIYLTTLGSRGDNEPFRALATEAAERGHEVHFAHTHDLPFDKSAGYTEWELPGSIEKWIAESGVSVIKALRDYKEHLGPMQQDILRASEEHIRSLRPDVVVYHSKVQTAPVVAHEVGALAVLAEMMPIMTPTTEFATGAISANLGPWLNRQTYRLVDWGIAAFGDQAKTLAKQLGVASWKPDLTLCAVSPTLLARPHDWPDKAVITGQWKSHQPGELDGELESFVTNGNVLYAGVGSMKRGNPRRRARVIVDAARVLGMKTLLVTGWGGLEADDEMRAADDVLVRESVNHTALAPLLSAAIHHGGAGTTHTMLRAGVPSVIMPFIVDQPWWAKRLHAAGLGPTSISANCRSATRLAAKISDALSYTDTVTAASESLRAEHGVAVALDEIEARV